MVARCELRGPARSAWTKVPGGRYAYDLIRSDDEAGEPFMRARSVVVRGSVLLLAAVVLTGCASSGGHGTASGQSTPAARAVAATVAPGPGSSATAAPTPSGVFPSGLGGVQQVRDAFAELQATYTDSGCATPGNCPYFLNRVLTNLDDLDNAMKASSEGQPHFRLPLGWIAQTQAAFHDDVSFDNLDKHQKLLLSTRDRINSWIQAYPQDYR
ncbi:hypothetical protein ABH940_003726 [Streptacidiphilus sp. BW17]